MNGRPNSLQVCCSIGSSGCDFLAPVPEQWLCPCVSSGWDEGYPRECHPGPGKGSGRFSVSEWELGAQEMCRARQEWQ